MPFFALNNLTSIVLFYVSLRCGIPVVVMGETGCGKTRLIRFMCELQAGPKKTKNLLLMKVGHFRYAFIVLTYLTIKRFSIWIL